MLASINEAAAKIMEHLTEFVLLSMGNLALVRRDAYVKHFKSGHFARTAPLHIPILFPDSVIERAEEKIAHYENKGQASSSHGKGRVHPMDVRTRSRVIGRTTGWRNQHGRTLVKCVTGKTRDVLQTFHHDQPRASSLINDNYCVDKLQVRLLARSKEPTQEKTVNSL